MKRLFIALIRFYQLAISPYLGKNCRFFPSCSEYAIEAINEHGSFQGTLLSLKRIVRCGPWCAGGVDPVPTSQQKEPSTSHQA